MANLANLRYLLIVAFALSILTNTFACVALDYRFTLNIGGININEQPLIKACSPAKCVITDDYISLISHYDSRVTVLIGRTPSIFGFRGVSLRLPYAISEEGIPYATEINPEKFDWKNAVKTDLAFLKKLGVIEISDSEILQISKIADSGKNIMVCNGKWQAFEANCRCENDSKVCVKCFGTAPVTIKRPLQLLEFAAEESGAVQSTTPIAQPEQSQELLISTPVNPLLFLLLAAGVILIVIGLILRAKR
ncbi:MAG: hypothetical protein J7L14_00845 [Candidatus Diapherotrites archaeon]|nr:hypothetical protein [Candidatus Diapherotrites archaeon]